MLSAIDKQYSSQPLAVLQIDNLQLAFPQHQIASVNLASDMDTEKSTTTIAGWITKDKQAWPVYAMSDSLSVLSFSPKQRRFCVCFHPVSGQHHIGLAVDAIDSMELHDFLTVQSLPDCMKNPRSPVTQVIKNEDELVFMSDADNLYRYVQYEVSDL